MSLPKVLIINQPFNNNTGGGITLTNLFDNWDREKLAVACSGYLLTKDMDPKLCNNYYQLGSKERKWIFPFNLVARKYYSGPITFSESTRDKIVSKKSKFRERLIINYALPFLEYIRFDHFKTRIEISSQFCKWMSDFNPDVIYMQSSSLEDLAFCLELNKYSTNPLVFHMMDDWPSTIANRGIMKKYWNRKINNKLKELLNHTDLAMSISDYMAEEYKRRYGKEFITFHNPININFWESSKKKDYGLHDPPVLLYAGRVGLGIDKSLTTIAKAVDQVNKKTSMRLRFELQTAQIPNWAKNQDCVEHRSFVDYNELPRVFAEADLLILPYDFSAKSISFIKYSMPTKASEYMASGTPIIIFAPEDTALVKYAKSYDWAIVVTENRVDILADKLAELMNNISLRKITAQNAQRISKEKHDANNVALNFQNVISSVVKK